MTAKSPDSFSAIRRLQILGGLVVLLMVVGVGVWATETEISGAVIARGQIVAESNTKKVQHAEGGIVGEIRARNGDRVRAGDIVVRLDATTARANMQIVTKKLNQAVARRARLLAERDGLAEIAWPSAFAAPVADIAQAKLSELRVFQSRRASRSGQKQQLEQRKLQIFDAINGMNIQLKAKAEEIALIKRELTGSRKLWSKGLTVMAKLISLERQRTRTEGEHGNLIASIARARARIAETELQITQVDQDLTREVARELREVEASIGELEERRVAVADELRRTDVRAPRSGIVHQSGVHTIGGVIAAGETIMQIVPAGDALVVEARIDATDIDQLYIDQSAVLRFPAFNQRTTPELTGAVGLISPDTTPDRVTGQRHYLVRITIADAELAKLGRVSLIPGMPVEAFIKTEDRDVLSYLLKPLTDQFRRAFRET